MCVEITEAEFVTKDGSTWRVLNMWKENRGRDCYWRWVYRSLWSIQSLRMVLHAWRKMTNQWRIQDFPDGGGGRQLPRWGAELLFNHFFPKNCMKMKELGPRGGGARDATDPPLPMTQKTFHLNCSTTEIHSELWKKCRIFLRIKDKQAHKGKGLKIKEV